MSNLTLDLDFSTPEPPITCPAGYFATPAPLERIYPTAHSWEDGYYGDDGGTNGAMTFCADEPLPAPIAKAADTFALARLDLLNPHAYAFVATARHYGHTDRALAPVRVSAAGRQEFDEAELARFANELLRGVRSDRPAMTPERWAEASAKAREIGEANGSS